MRPGKWRRLLTRPVERTPSKKQGTASNRAIENTNKNMKYDTENMKLRLMVTKLLHILVTS